MTSAANSCGYWKRKPSASVRVDDQLGIREMAREEIEFTVGTMMSLLPLATRVGCSDPGQPRELAHVGDAPVIDRFRLGVAHGQGRSLIAVLFAGEDPAQELLAPGLARLGRREEEIKPVLDALDILVGVPADFFTPVMESTAALRAGAAEDQPAHQAGAQQDDFLRHEPTGGEAEQVDLLQAESVDESEDVAGESSTVPGWRR